MQFLYFAAADIK